jgi:hypothetical protein
VFDAGGGGGINQVPLGGGNASVFVSSVGFAIGLAINSTGTLFVTSDGSGNIDEVSPEGNVSTFVTGLISLGGLAFNSTGTLFVADTGANKIYEVTPAGVVSTFATGVSGSYLAFGPAGAVAPAITTQPTNATVTAGNSTTFTSGASGTPTPTFQWQISTDGGIQWGNLSDGSGISGSATDELTVSNVMLAQSGDEFQLFAFNQAGNATSDPATLTVESNTTGTQNYTFLTLDYPDADALNGGTQALGISGGNVVGYYTDATFHVHGWIYNIVASNYTTLNDPSGANISAEGTRAYGIDGGNVVGDYVDSSGAHHGFLYTIANETFATFDDPEAGNIGGSGTFPKGISGGNIVGTYTDGNFTQHSFLYNGTAFTTLADDPAAKANTTVANGISGDSIVGYYSDSSSDIHGFLYDLATTNFTATLDDPEATNQTQAMGIAGGNIVGYYLDNTGDHGFLYNGTAYSTLDDPAGSISSGGMGTFAYGVDSSGDVVGRYEDGLGSSHGFLATPAAANTTPSFSLNPTNQVVTAGQDAGFSANATGTPSPSFQWQFSTDSGSNWSNLTASVFFAGVTTPDLVIMDANVTLNGDQFRLFAFNQAGNATSGPATLTVNSTTSAPAITTQPVNAAVLAGKSASFTVAATGSGTLTYQWYFNSKKIPNATSATYSITKVAAANAGNYSVVISNGIDSPVTSNTVTLTLATAPAITTQPKALTLNYGASGSLTVAATGNPAPNYLWHLNNKTINAGNVSGITTSKLTFTAATTANAGSYTVTVSNNFGSKTSTAAKLTVKLVAPKITKQPKPATVSLGGTASFVVVASGSPTLKYQWTFNGKPATGGNIFGATSANLTITPVGSANKGSYQVTVTNSAGSVKSSTVKLTVK